jgi:hypothetical protein
MGISYEEALMNGLISETTRNMLPDKCACGSKYELNDSLTVIQCTNKKCKEYLIDRIENFNVMVGLDIDKPELRNIVKKLNIQTPYQILMLDEALSKDVITSKDLSNHKEVVDRLDKIKKAPVSLVNIVRICGIKVISKVAYKIFDGFNTIDEAYTEIETRQITFINERLGIKDTDSSIFSADIYSKIIELKDEFILAEMLLNVQSDNQDNIIRIAFTDNVQPYVNKSEFVEFLNDKYSYKFILLSSVNDNTDILVSNALSQNTKYRTARIINNEQIAKEMKAGELELKDAEKKIKYQLKPRGCKIFIDSLENVLDKLDEIERHNAE